ncbi:MAG TPA: hypothetical protein VFC39_14140 [Acidobacteriaceae bacterium]|nr:hypothetical protein [Acidobacteriaceae bacterium]
MPNSPNFRRKRPAPRTATGWGKSVSDTVNWTRVLDPRESYRIVYIDRDNEQSDRIIDLLKLGDVSGTPYLGVMHQGRFKTLRADRVIGVEQLSSGHQPSIHAQPTYSTELPQFPLPNAVYKIPTTAVSNRTWTVDLNTYICACPEKRIRSGYNYKPGQLGFVCDHMAKAILANLPSAAAGWPPELLRFLADSRRVHIYNLC